MGRKKKLIVKYGSSSVVSGSVFDQKKINSYAAKLVALREEYDLNIVASGSVAFAQKVLKDLNRDSEKFDQQVLASIGSAGASEAWRNAFNEHDILAGQVLVTHHEIEDMDEGSRLTLAIKKNTQNGVVSVFNVNDLLSTNELQKIAFGGDNDGLASHLAIRFEVDTLLLLTDVDGFKENGAIRSTVRLKEIEELQRHIDQANQLGKGGMKSKLEAAARAAEKNIEAYIGNADADYQEILDKKEGTRVTV